MKSIQTPEYHQKFKNNIHTKKDKTWNGKRKRFVEKYGWTIPNKKFIEELISQNTILEIGAGNGYIAYEVNKYSNTIYPIDIKQYENSWVNVDKKSLTDITNTDTFNTILLCWPPANEPLAYQAINTLNPETVYFAGIPNSTITADKSFHYKMEHEYRVQKQISLPSWLDNEKEKLIKYNKI